MSVFLKNLQEELNIPQQEAVTQLEKPLLVLSGAGTGKTRTISYKIAYLILEQGYDIGRVLSLTFTNKSAKEMKSRTVDLIKKYTSLDEVTEKRLYIGTFHANCVKILRWHGKILGYTSSFSIIDDDDQLSLIKRIIKEYMLKNVSKPNDVRKALSRLKNDFLTPKEVISLAERTNDLFLKDVGFLYEKYQEELLRSNAMDFDDIQLNVIHLLNKDKNIQLFWQNHFQAILVDEFQDTNKVQFLLLKMLMGGEHHQTICFVGDDDQSIYSFRGANIGNILNLAEDFPNLQIIRLEENYRSYAPILHLANHTISHNENRLGKILYAHHKQESELPSLFIAQTDEQEAQFCIETIIGLKSADETAAIVYRTNSQSKIFERELVRKAIPYILLGGRKFYEKKEIKDIFAYLRVLNNPSDNLAMLRLLNTPPRGIGDISKEKLFQYAKENQLTLYDVLQNIPSQIRLSQVAKEKLSDCFLILKDLQEVIHNNPEDLLKILLEAIAYKSYLEDYDKDEYKTQERFLSLGELERAYRKHLEEGSFASFVESVALMDSSDTHNSNSTHNHETSGIILTSVHGCKGLEFDYVFVVGLVEEIFPHYLSIETKEQLEEERRLFYVAVTRARKGLFLISPAKMFLRGQWEFFYQSRFIQELPKTMIQTSQGSLSKIDEKWYKDLL